MMLVVDLSPLASAAPVESRLARLYDDLATSQGDDGRIVGRTLRKAFEHWTDRAQCLLEESPDEDLDLKPIQLRTIGTMRVTYVPGKRLRAMPYDFGDE